MIVFGFTFILAALFGAAVTAIARFCNYSAGRDQR